MYNLIIREREREYNYNVFESESSLRSFFFVEF